MRKYHSVTLTYFLEVNICKRYISETVRASVKMCGRQCRFRYLPLNGVIAKITLRDLDLICEGKFFLIVIYLKRQELEQKFVGDIGRI